MSRIYDSSAITQRRRDQAQAGSFINRIQNPNNPQTSYGPLQGNYDASIMNSVKMGQPKEFYRNSGCIIISNGCPCPPIAVDEIVSGPTPPVILVPGSVSNITVEYGSVIVRWNAPTEGGAPTSYTLIADDQTNSANSVTITGIPSTIYTFPTYTGPAVDQLTAGDEYLFSVIAVNSAGSGTAEVSSSFYAPYIAPISTTTSVEYLPNRIDITLTPYAVFIPATYILKTYTNNNLSSTSTSQTYSSDLIIVNTNLSCLNVYTFQVQLLGNLNEYSSFSVKGANVPVYPYGPNFLSSPNDVTNITTTTAQVNYADYTIEGFDLTTGNAECILNSVPAIGYTQLTNTSVTLSGLREGTNYPLRSITISFRKTIQGNVITSPPKSLPAFTTANIIPGSVSNILAIYGTTGTNVTWVAPTTGGTVASYTLFANDQTTPANSVTITGITDVSYIFPTYTGPALNQLTAGDEYLFSVTAVNSAGSGAAEVSSSFYAPYSAASGVSAQALITNANTIFINFSAYEFGTGLPPTYYTVIQYTNGTYATTTTALYGTNQIAISGLNGTDDYSFQFQLSRPTDNKYTSYTSLTTPTKTYPAGPTNINYSNYSTTSVKINYENFSTNGYELSGATCTITNGTTTLTIQAGSLTNTSVIVESLSPVTPYANYTISFSKSPYKPSAPSNLTTFTTNGIAPTNVSALAPEGGTITSSGNNATIVFNEYISGIGHPGEFNFDNTSIVSIPGASPSIESIVSTSEIYIGSLDFATTYTGCRLILKNTGGDISDPSNTFTIVTKSSAPTGVSQISSTLNSVTCNLDPYSLPITQIIAYDTSSGTPPYTTTYSVSIVSQTEFIILGLTDSTSYTVGITVFNGTYISVISASFSISTQSPPPPPPDAPASVTLGTSSYFTQPITYQPYAISLTGAIISGGYGYSNLSQSGLTITGLSPGTGPPSYSGLTVQVQNAGGTSSASSIPDFTTLSLPAPEETFVVGDYDSVGNTTTITVIFTSYPAYPEFNPTSGTLQAPGVGQLGFFLSVSATSLVMTGLGPGYYYTDCYITLTDGSYTTPNSNTFTVPTTPIIGAQQQPSPSSDPITITYGDVTSFNFSVSSAKLYVPGQSQSPITSNNPGNSSSQFQTGLTPTTYSGCYIILYNSSSQSTLPSSTFSIEIQSSPPPPSYPAPDVYTPGISTGTDYVTIPYSQYNAFNPSGGTLYVNGAQTGSVSSIYDTYMTVSVLASGTLYDNCYITLTDGSNTSDPSYPTYSYFSFTTYPTAPISVQLGTTAYCTQLITFDGYSATLTGAIISDSGAGVYGYTNLTQSSLTITGLTPGSGYSLSVQVVNAGGTSNSSSISYFATNYLDPPTNVTNIEGQYDTNTNTATITLTFNPYPSAFTPTSGILYDNTAGVIGSNSTIVGNSIIFTGLTVGNSYTDCNITLTDGSCTTGSSNGFNVTTIPAIGAYQSSSPNSSPLIITYNDMGSYFFSVYRGTLYIPSGGGQYNSTNATNTQIEISQSFTLGQYDGCYIILYNNSNPEVPTLRSNTFTIDIQ